MPKITAPVKEAFELSPTHKYAVGDSFVQPDWYADRNVLRLWLAGTIGDFDFDLLEPDIKELALSEEQRQIIAAADRCGGCR